MKFEEFKASIPVPVFELGFVRQAFSLSAKEALSFSVQLSRWESKGWIHRLRRGLYAFPESGDYAFAIANQIVNPSYISGEYALAFYGMIPEAVFEVTSACEIAPRRATYHTLHGRYSYRQVKLFKGFAEVVIGGSGVLMATPEKALLDTWHWLSGEWTLDRHREMRYGNLELVDPKKLVLLGNEFRSHRIHDAIVNFLDCPKNDCC